MQISIGLHFKPKRNLIPIYLKIVATKDPYLLPNMIAGVDQRLRGPTLNHTYFVLLA